MQGVIQGEDLQVYTPSLSFTITDRSTRHQCNCSDAFTGICRHVAALALRLVEELRKEQGDPEETPLPGTDWKQSFRNFFSTDMEPEPGRHYLIFRFAPEQGRLLVSFFRGRQNKSGLSTVHTEVTLEQIIQNPGLVRVSPQLPHVARQIGQHLDYYGHRVEIPDGLTSWFFWSVRKEYYLLWKDSDKPAASKARPLPPSSSPAGRYGLQFRGASETRRPPAFAHSSGQCRQCPKRRAGQPGGRADHLSRSDAALGLLPA